MKSAFLKTYTSFKQFIPLFVGILLLVSYITVAIPPEWYGAVFRGNAILDPLIGAFIGSVSSGNPITSYIIGGELRSVNVSLLAVTSFIIAWVTVGVIQLPAESLLLGKKFALVRNGLSFLMAIIIALLVILTLPLI